MKADFDLDTVLTRVSEAVARFPKAAMFELAERGYGTLFEQLISCVISIRTLDEVSLPVSERLFAVARTAQQLAQLTPDELILLLHGTTYPEPKAYTLLGIANRIVTEFNGALPADYETLERVGELSD